MKDYIKDAVRTEAPITEETIERMRKSARLIHAVMGFATEAGEAVDELKKHIFYGKDLDETNLVEEAGDKFWYLALMCDVLNVSFEEVMLKNNAKLRARFPQHFTRGHALDRNLEAEREILEQDHSVQPKEAINDLTGFVLDVTKKYILYDAATGENIESGKYIVLRLDNGNNPIRGHVARMACRLYTKLARGIESLRQELDKINQVIIAEDEKEPPLRKSSL